MLRSRRRVLIGLSMVIFIWTSQWLLQTNCECDRVHTSSDDPNPNPDKMITHLTSSSTKTTIAPISEGKGLAYCKRLFEIANNDKVIILALVDQGFVDVAINFWEISIKPFKIDNMLFVSLSKKACKKLSLFSIPCHVYEDFSGGEDDSAYMSPIFLKKMNTRTQFLLDALSWNFTVLNTDTDVIFFKNPMNHFKCSDCHLEILEDGVPKLLNAGFVYLRPTSITAAVYKRMAAVAKSNPRTEDQAVLNRVIKHDLNGKIKYNLLNSSQFLCGKTYYEHGKRYFADTASRCDSCVVVHNNWIVSKAAKIYRQKEMLQWVYDGGRYYSDPNRKYLMYENTLVLTPSKVTEEEKLAIINAFAIGQILNRTVILPHLHCKSNICPWNSRFYISHIDHLFGGKYRESMFLKHPKVPNVIKESVSQPFLIMSSKHSLLKVDKDVIIKEPHDITHGATSEEILEWFGDCKQSVLRFHSLYDAFKGFTNKNEQIRYNSVARPAFKKAGYRQY